MGSLDTWLAPTMAVWVLEVSSWKLIGFIRAIPANIHTYDTEKMVKINFLCVHKTLRSKRVAPILICEITQRVHLENIFQVARVVLPKPVDTCRYWYWSLNPWKLIEGFPSEQKYNHAAAMKFYQVPEPPKTTWLHPMRKKEQSSSAPVYYQEPGARRRWSIGSTPRRISLTLWWWRMQTVRWQTFWAFIHCTPLLWTIHPIII